MMDRQELIERLNAIAGLPEEAWDEWDGFLAHIGTPHEGSTPHSGRFEYGSGENPLQRDNSIRGTVAYLRKQGLSDAEIATQLGISQNQMRDLIKAEKAATNVPRDARIKALLAQGKGATEIGKELGMGESSVRARIKAMEAGNDQKVAETTDILREAVADRKYIDVGVGTATGLGISENKLNGAIAQLLKEGYTLKNYNMEQLGTGNYTHLKVLCPPGTEWEELDEHVGDITPLLDWRLNESDNSVLGLKKPESLDPNRVSIRYAEEGGKAKDGVMELRPGVDDISLGQSNYAQVRVNVGDELYLKGMAVYGDPKDFPPGVDVIFNTNKHEGTPFEKVLKPLKETTEGSGDIDWDNPFGASIKRQSGVMNIVSEEGDWDNWSDTLASQFLSKQPRALIRQQLDLTYMDYKDQLDDIRKINNPELKRMMLEEFADKCDAAAVHLKAVALPRQAAKVILPLTSIGDDEIYAPTYENGEQVALVRYPHAGTFEIPILTVNNGNAEGKRVITPESVDAVGIGSKTAARLSGADFDGDTVVVIPMKGQKIKSTSPLAGLVDFDPSEAYPLVEIRKDKNGDPVYNQKPMTEKYKQKQMGIVSNLITDMTLQGASDEELARAVRHSMVVIDAVKHKLDFRQSEKDNQIDELKRKYQAREEIDPDTGEVLKKYGGASTLISRAKSEKRVNLQKEIGPDPETGERRYVDSNRTYYNKKIFDDNGNFVGYAPEKSVRTTKTTQMAQAKDARELMSSKEGTLVERLYANYANKQKALANSARKEMLAVGKTKRDKSSVLRQEYAEEIESLERQLKIAELNAPLERHAQAIANAVVRSAVLANPALKDDTNKKYLQRRKGQALSEARTRTGANKRSSMVKITPREWNALNSGVFSSDKIQRILRSARSTPEGQRAVMELASPRQTKTLSSTKVARIRSYSKAGYNIGEIAAALDISPSTVSTYLKEGRGSA